MAGRKVQSLFSSGEEELDERIVEEIHVHFQRCAASLRQLEKKKIAKNICIVGISCTRQAVKGRSGGYGYGCPHHLAAKRAGVKLARWTSYESEYGKLQKRRQEEAKEEATLEAEKERRRAASKRTAPPRRRAA